MNYLVALIALLCFGLGVWIGEFVVAIPLSVLAGWLLWMVAEKAEAWDDYMDEKGD